jgi:hypothetical protein
MLSGFELFGGVCRWFLNERVRSYNYQDVRVSDHRVGITLQVCIAWGGWSGVGVTVGGLIVSHNL